MIKQADLLQNRYLVEQCIGNGGSGEVYLVEDLRLNKKWAMKCVPTVEQNAIREAMILKDLKHNGIPLIVDVFAEEENCCMIMEYIEGITLEEWIDRNKRASEKEVLNWLHQLAEILFYLHAHRPSILYLDMKPANIMITGENNLKLLDFGAAILYLEHDGQRKTKTQCYGSVGYASPEQRNCQRESINQRSDIYSLGITMRYLLTGISPLKPPSEKMEIRKINPAISKGLEKIVNKMTQKEQTKRFVNCEELLSKLAGVCNQNKWDEIRKQGIMILFYSSFLLTAILAGIGLERTQVEQWAEYKSYLKLSLFLFFCSALLRRIVLQHNRKKYPYSVLQNIILTDKKGIGLWCMFVLASALLSFQGVEHMTEERELSLIQDEQFRTILIKENSIYYTKEAIYIACNKKRESERYQVSIQGSGWMTLEKSGYYLAAEQLREQEEVMEITFRQKKGIHEKIYQQTVLLAYG